MARSLINAFPGLPPGVDNESRIVIITAWNMEGMKSGIEKMNALNAKHWPDMERLDEGHAIRTLGTEGADGPEWFYAAAVMHDDDVNESLGATSDRYGFHRWIWTEDTDAEQEGKAE